MKRSPCQTPEPLPESSGRVGHEQDEIALESLPRAGFWLVDGYNVLHCAPFRREYTAANAALDAPSAKPFWSETARERLLTVARCFPDRDAEIWLVFDGSHTPQDPRPITRPALKLRFAPSADDWIVQQVRDSAWPSEIAVVSGDRRLTGRARHHGAAVVSPRLFLQHCFAAQMSNRSGP